MRQSCRFLAWSLSLAILAACGTMAGRGELRPLQADPGQPKASAAPTSGQQRTMAQTDVQGLLDHARQQAQKGDRAAVVQDLYQLRSKLGQPGVFGAGVSAKRLEPLVDRAISQITQTRENAREVAAINVGQIQDALQALQGHDQNRAMGQGSSNQAH